ncbi:MAG: hypothetical protein NVSMB27_38400 [Ktedonobacteraceae bacterium]
MPEVDTTLKIGTIIRGRYEVEDGPGKKSSGAVYLVRDRRNGQKLFVLKEVPDLGWKVRYQFAFESRFFKRPDHMALPHVYQVFKDRKLDRAFMLMEYIEGSSVETLRLKQPEQRFPLVQVISLIAPIMNAVTYLHNQRHPIIHGDIKPFSIIIRKKDAQPVLVGFSLAGKFRTETIPAGEDRGTGGYKAPEQYRGETGPRSDIYALGAVLYTLLTGTVPADALYRAKCLEEQQHDPLFPMDEIAPDIRDHLIT